MTTIPHAPAWPPSARARQILLWISLANLASLAWGLPEAQSRLIHIYRDFHVELGPLCNTVLSIHPAVYVLAGGLLAGMSLAIQFRARSKAGASRFHLAMILLTTIFAAIFGWAVMGPMANVLVQSMH